MMTAPTLAVDLPATAPLRRPRRHRLHTTVQTLLPQATCREGCDLGGGLYTPAAILAADHARATGHTTVVTAATSTVYRPEVRS
jgi:hypothetical protein